MNMSVWLAEELIRRVQRLSAHRSLWHHVPMTFLTPSQSPGLQFVHTWRPRQRETCVSGSPVGPIRFFSSVNHEEKDLVPSASLPADDVRGSELPQRSLFYDELQRCGSASDVLDLTCRRAPTLRQTSSCLTHMWNTTKKMSEEQQRLEQRLMFEHVALDKLLSTAARSAARMRDEDLAYSLLALVNLGVPQRSRVVQTFLRACQVTSGKNRNILTNARLCLFCDVFFKLRISIHSKF